MASASRAGRGAIEASRRLLGRGWQGTRGLSRARDAGALGGEEVVRTRRVVGTGIGTVQRIAAAGTSIATGNVLEQQGKTLSRAATWHRRGGGGEEEGAGEGQQMAGRMETERCWVSGIARRSGGGSGSGSGSHGVAVGASGGAVGIPVPIARAAMAMELPKMPNVIFGGEEQRRGFLFLPRTAACRDLDLSSSGLLAAEQSTLAGRRKEIPTAAPFGAYLAGKKGFGGNGRFGGWNARATRGMSSESSSVSEERRPQQQESRRAKASAGGESGSLEEISARIFGNVIGNGLRSGHKILRQKLVGEKIASWYPKPIQKSDPMFEGIKEKRRLLKLERLKRRGKGPPKKGQGKRAAKRGSK